MTDKHDILDDIIGIQEDWNVVSNPLSDVADRLIADPDKRPVYNPGDYKDRPRAISGSCLRIISGKPAACSLCLRVCPTKSIVFDGKNITIADNCRKCGLCIAVCPTEAMTAQRQMAKQLYDKIARVANIYEQCYVSCTRAMGRIPKDNEVLLPCVGVISSELWFSLLVEYGNISVYLPLGICDRCRTTTGENTFSDAIAKAEKLAHDHVGLEVTESAMTHEQSRAFKRTQFVSNMAQAGTQLLSRTTPMLAGAQVVANRMKAHTNQINTLQRSLEQITGTKNPQSRRRLLTQKRKLVLTALQDHPGLAKGFTSRVPVCDSALCTMCGECSKVCPEHACALDERGHFSVEPAYCLNCGTCALVCSEGALVMEPLRDTSTLIVPDPQKQKAAEQKAKVAAAKKKGKKVLRSGLSALETFANELDNNYDKK